MKKLIKKGLHKHHKEEKVPFEEYAELALEFEELQEDRLENQELARKSLQVLQEKLEESESALELAQGRSSEESLSVAASPATSQDDLRIKLEALYAESARAQVETSSLRLELEDAGRLRMELEQESLSMQGRIAEAARLETHAEVHAQHGAELTAACMSLRSEAVEARHELVSLRAEQDLEHERQARDIEELRHQISDRDSRLESADELVVQLTAKVCDMQARVESATVAAAAAAAAAPPPAPAPAPAPEPSPAMQELIVTLRDELADARYEAMMTSEYGAHDIGGEDSLMLQEARRLRHECSVLERTLAAESASSGERAPSPCDVVRIAGRIDVDGECDSGPEKVQAASNILEEEVERLSNEVRTSFAEEALAKEQVLEMRQEASVLHHECSTLEKTLADERLQKSAQTASLCGEEAEASVGTGEFFELQEAIEEASRFRRECDMLEQTMERAEKQNDRLLPSEHKLASEEVVCRRSEEEVQELRSVLDTAKATAVSHEEGLAELEEESRCLRRESFVLEESLAAERAQLGTKTTASCVASRLIEERDSATQAEQSLMQQEHSHNYAQLESALAAEETMCRNAEDDAQNLRNILGETRASKGSDLDELGEMREEANRVRHECSSLEEALAVLIAQAEKGTATACIDVPSIQTNNGGSQFELREEGQTSIAQVNRAAQGPGILSHEAHEKEGSDANECGKLREEAGNLRLECHKLEESLAAATVQLGAGAAHTTATAVSDEGNDTEVSMFPVDVARGGVKEELDIPQQFEALDKDPSYVEMCEEAQLFRDECSMLEESLASSRALLEAEEKAVSEAIPPRDCVAAASAKGNVPDEGPSYEDLEHEVRTFDQECSMLQEALVVARAQSGAHDVKYFQLKRELAEQEAVSSLVREESEMLGNAAGDVADKESCQEEWQEEAANFRQECFLLEGSLAGATAQAEARLQKQMQLEETLVVTEAASSGAREEAERLGNVLCQIQHTEASDMATRDEIQAEAHGLREECSLLEQTLAATSLQTGGQSERLVHVEQQLIREEVAYRVANHEAEQRSSGFRKEAEEAALQGSGLVELREALSEEAAMNKRLGEHALRAEVSRKRLLQDLSEAHVQVDCVEIARVLGRAARAISIMSKEIPGPTEEVAQASHSIARAPLPAELPVHAHRAIAGSLLPSESSACVPSSGAVAPLPQEPLGHAPFPAAGIQLPKGLPALPPPLRTGAPLPSTDSAYPSDRVPQMLQEGQGVDGPAPIFAETRASPVAQASAPLKLPAAPLGLGKLPAVPSLALPVSAQTPPPVGPKPVMDASWLQ